jgi:hypothetical protein
LRFAEVFRATWERLPEHDRGQIRTAWHDLQAKMPAPGYTPRIELRDGLYKSKGVFAGCGLGGNELLFDGPLSTTPAHYLAWHVADVLARVLRHVRGEADETYRKAEKEARRRGQREMTHDLFIKGEQKSVEEILHTWGFPTDRPSLYPEWFWEE